MGIVRLNVSEMKEFSTSTHFTNFMIFVTYIENDNRFWSRNNKLHLALLVMNLADLFRAKRDFDSSKFASVSSWIMLSNPICVFSSHAICDM